MHYDDYEVNELKAERLAARRRNSQRARHFDPRDPDYIPDEDEDACDE